MRRKNVKPYAFIIIAKAIEYGYYREGATEEQRNAIRDRILKEVELL